MGSYNQYKARGCTYTKCKSQHMLHTLALWGQVTYYGEGGASMWQGGQVKFYPYKRGGWGAEKSFSHAEGGRAQKVLTWELEVLAIVKGGGQNVSTL